MNKNGKWLWFNIGQKEDYYVTWQCCVINENFNPKSIKFQDYKWDNEGNYSSKWVKKEDLSYPLHKSVKSAFNDLEKVAEWVKTVYETGNDLYVGTSNWVHIYEIFDMDNLNEWGLGEIVKTL